MSQKLKLELKELGSKLESPPTPKDALLKLLKHATTVLSDLDQSPSAPILESMQPFLKAIVKPELLKHQDKDVKLLVASCLCEITRITAPEAPYSDEILKDIFGLIVGTFSGLNDPNGPSFGRRVIILETLARYRSCVVMLDLECDDLVTEIFRSLIAAARDDHSDNVLASMKAIMVVLLEESEEIHEDIILTLLSNLGRNKKDITKASRNLSTSVIKDCATKLEPAIKHLLISSMSGESGSSDCQIDHHEVIFDLYRCSPETLSGVVPYLTGELLADESETRLRAARLVGELFAIPDQAIAEEFQPVFSEFLKRLTDRAVDVRMSVLDYIKSCLLSYSSRPEAPQVYDALCDRLLDYDENVRRKVVAVVCDVACQDIDSVPVETVKLVAERLRDKSLLVKKYTIDRLAEIYRLDCSRGTEGSTNNYSWIPGKILRCFYDKDFRADTIECVLCETIFPPEFTVKQRVSQWIKIIPGLDKVEVKALEKILEQKQRLQQEMQKYLAFKQTYKDSDAPDSQKKGMLFFRVMSRCFTDPAKAEESFQVLDQLKDANIWKILATILDPNTSFGQARSSRDDALKILGEKHPLFDFFSILSVKCSYILFNKEHVKETLLEVVALKSAAVSQGILSCMNMLVILARYCALLFAGSEEELLNLLKDDDEIIKEGILHVLATAGGTIREGLASSSISVDLILERLCLEGSRRQAKYAVHALAAITKDDGLLSLSVLYKRLVDMLEEKPHLPSVLQSLGCIAQTAMAVFETRESEITEFIKNKILQSSNRTKDKKKVRWQDRSELCLHKIYGIKTLVKSYLPVKDAHLRGGIDDIIEILRNILSFGEISKEIKSNSVDRAHLRLAAAKAVLRLSRHWDHQIPADVFHLTVRTIEINFSQARKLFRSKIHQYMKDRVLDAKYSCAFLFSISGPKNEFEESKRDLADIIQMCRQVRARQLSMQSDANCPMPYPEFILPFVVHSLAHHPLFPRVEECKDLKAFEPIYRMLYLFLSLVVRGDEDVSSEVKSAEKEKESISTVASILQRIKNSVDVLDAAKSKNSYGICDLGLSIIKRLSKQTDLHHDATASVSLPSTMYKPIEKEAESATEGDDTSTWLADDSVSVHFESLQLDVNGTVPPDFAHDEILEDNEIDGNELPLGKLIKQIKSEKIKAKKTANDSSPDKAKIAEQDVDVLKVVREINLDGLGISNKFESSNGNKERSVGITSDHDEEETKKRKGGEETSSPVPKRQRSSITRSPLKSSKPRSTKATVRTSMKERLSVKEDQEQSEPSSLVLCSKKKPQSPVLGQYNGEKSHSNEETEASDEEVEPDTETKGGSSSKSPGKASNKRKRRSVAGLSKDAPTESGMPTTDLIDCRIKVWWPLDKKFYEGVVKSYDPEKQKHVVLYADGDVEVLRLDKECWEIIPDSGKRSKSSKPSKSPLKLSSEKKKKSSGGSRSKKSDERDTPVKAKRSKKKGSSRKSKDILKDESVVQLEEAEHKSDLSDPEPAPASENDPLDSGEPEKADDEVESLPPKEEEESESGEEDMEGGGKKNDTDSKEAEEEAKPVIEGDQDVAMEDTREASHNCDFRKSDLEDREDESDSSPDEKQNTKLAEEAESRPEEENKPQASEPLDADDEDEPLKVSISRASVPSGTTSLSSGTGGNWKRRIGKSLKGK